MKRKLQISLKKPNGNEIPITNLLTKNIRTKLLLYFLPVSLAAILIMGFVSFGIAKNSIQDEMVTKLQSILDLKEVQINEIFSSINSDMYLLQNDYVIKPTVSVLTEYKNNPLNEQSVLSKIILDEQFDSFLTSKVIYNHIFLLDITGDLIYENSHKNNYNLDISKNELTKKLKLVFENSKTDNFLSDVFRDGNQYVMYFGAPIYDLENKFAGVVILEVDMKQVFSLIQDPTGLGETGETLLGKMDSDAVVFLSPIRQDSEAALERKVSLFDERPIPIIEAVQGISGQGHRVDYDGEPILAVWKYIPSLDWGLVVKMDSSEVMKPVIETQIFGIIVTSSFALIITLLTLVASSKILKPILRLRSAMTQIEKGNYDVKIVPTGNDEIYDLMKSTRKMAETMQQKQVLNDGIMEEISNQKDELATFIKALNESSLVAITDKDGVITYANDKFSEISKYQKEELIGQTHMLLNSDYHPEIFFKGMKQVISQGHVWRGDIKYKAKDGGNYWVRTTIVPFMGKHGTPEQFIRISTDITSQKFTEEKLHNTLEELGKVDRLKEEFSTMVSHELKTPLTPIKGYCEILKEDGVIGKLTNDQHEAIDEIDRNASRLERLVGDILDAQKLDMGKMNFHKRIINLEHFMKEVEKDLSNFMKTKGIQFSVKNFAKINVNSDPERLRQVIDNMAKNAVDFVPKETGKIEIGSMYEDKNVIFYIKDNGVGISEEDQLHLFKKFYQVNTSHTRKHGGTGLGLVICKGIVEELGGKIWVKSEKAKGAIFYFSIPIQESEIKVKSQN